MQQQEDQINSNQTVQISAQQFASKYKSKREVYHLLILKGGAYLPKHTNLTI